MNKNYLISLFLAFFTTTVSAETLDDAWNNAIDNNHQIKSAKAEIGASEQQLQATENQRLPTLNVSSGYTQYSETPTAKTDIGGRTALFSMAQPGSFKAQAIASLPIYTGGKITHNINAAQAALKATQSNEITSVSNIKMQVAEAYIMVLRVENGLQVAQNHVDTLERHIKDVNNLFEQGIVAKNDQLAASVELANAKQEIVQVMNQLDIARAHYNQLLDRNLTQDVKLANKFPSIPTENITELSNNALKQRTELVAISQQIESLEHQSKSVKAGLLPQVGINGGYQYQQNRYQAYEGMWMANVGVEWKLDAGSTHASDAITGQALALKEQRDNLSSLIGLQVRQAWLNYDEAKKRIAVTQQSITQADENLKVTTDRYQQGLSTNTDVLRAEDLRTMAHNNFNNATFDSNLAILQLRRAIGIL